jgi:hypothetical protein
MGPLGKGILVALLRAHVWHEDVAEEGREERLGVMAEATESAVLRATCAGGWPSIGCRPNWSGSRRRLAALLAMTAIWESALSRRIHAGDCRGAECDHGLSIGPWQVRRPGWMTIESWRGMAGVDLISTTDAAWYAATVLSRCRRRCRTDEGAVAMYATGRSCSWSGAAERVESADKIERWIRRGEREAANDEQ